MSAEASTATCSDCGHWMGAHDRHGCRAFNCSSPCSPTTRLTATLDALAAVRAAVDDQPHADRCKHTLWDGERPCNCWKTEILHALDGHATKEADDE